MGKVKIVAPTKKQRGKPISCLQSGELFRYVGGKEATVFVKLSTTDGMSSDHSNTRIMRLDTGEYWKSTSDVEVIPIDATLQIASTKEDC